MLGYIRPCLKYYLLLSQMSGRKTIVATGESVYTLPDILDLECVA